MAQNEIRAVWRLLIFLTIAGACAFLLGGLWSLVGRRQFANFTIFILLIRESILAVSVLVAAAVMARIERRSLETYGLPWRGAFRWHFWQGVVWGLVAVTALILLIQAAHGFSFGSLALHGPRLAGYAAFWAVGFLVVGFFEEFLFRGYAQFTLTTGMGFWPAAFLLSAAFGAVHLGNPGEEWVGALSAALIGLFFCLTVRCTGDIWFALGMHASFDYGETFIYSVPNSGFSPSTHLLTSSFHGPRWLTGGSVGPEGSVFAFVVVALLFLVFHLLYRRNSPAQGKAPGATADSG